MKSLFGRHPRFIGGVLAIALCLGVVVSSSTLWSSHSPQTDNSTVQPGHSQHYNVILISLDTVRADHLSCYGYGRRTTPNLDRLAEDSIRFQRCIASSNWTLPTHASMFTGLYPEAHGARFYAPEEAGGVPDYENGIAGRLTDHGTTLAEILNAAGYRTGAILANHGYLGTRFQLDQGFEHYDVRRGHPPEWYRKADEITFEAIRWLHDQQFHKRPFFLCLNYMDPHHPYNPPSEFMQAMAPEFKQEDELTPYEESYFRELIKLVSLERKPLPENLRHWLTARYDAELAFMDQEIGQLLEILRENDLYDETLIIVTADHGEALGEHTTLAHCFRMHEPEVAVPLIVKLPMNSETGVRTALSSHIDILPITLEVLGMQIPSELHGVPLSQLKGGSTRDVFSTKHFDIRMSMSLPPLNQKQSVLYRGSLKYIEYPAGQAELYNLMTDPQELHNLASQEPELVQEMAASLVRHRRECQPISEYEPPNGLDEPSDGSNALRELGYVQ